MLPTPVCMLKSKLLVPLNVTVFGSRAFKEVSSNEEIHGPSFGTTGVLLRRGNQNMHAEGRPGEDREKTAVCLQAKKRGLRRDWPADTLILDFSPPEPRGNEFLLFEHLLVCGPLLLGRLGL